MSNHSRLDIENTGINIDYLTTNDTIGLLVEKMNKNLREIAEHGGGPIGEPGKQGPPGCNGLPGPPGKDGESELEWIGRIAKSCDLTHHTEIHSINDIIVNKFTNRTLLLTNLEEVSISGDSILRNALINTEELSALRVSTELSEYKFKIYNSNDDGEGNHIHLLNSKAAANDNRFLCKSGFVISLDWDEVNLETLKIKAIENSEIENHTQNVEIQSDILKLKRNETSQEFNFEPGSKTPVTDPINEPHRLTKRLVDLTGARVQSVPDKTGYESVWTDVLDHSENWEIIENQDLMLNHIRYEFSDGSLIISNRPDSHLINIDDSSVVRFKRNNEWILVDFHIRLIDNGSSSQDFYLRNFQLKVLKDIIGCLTLGWHPTSFMENENYLDDGIDEGFGFFKIDSTNYDNKIDNTFIISYKFNKNNSQLFFPHNELKSYWFTGQVWATVQNTECSIITFDIEQGLSCPELNIEQQ